MELIDLIPNSKSFRVIVTLDISDESEIPEGFTGRVRLSTTDHLVYVAWYENGALHNPGRNHPAYRRFRVDGQVKYEMFYERGLLHDPSRRGAAVRGYYSNGVMHYAEHYLRGRRHDGANGQAAIQKWRQDGTLRHELHYHHGTRVFPTELNAAVNPAM